MNFMGIPMGDAISPLIFGTQASGAALSLPKMELGSKPRPWGLSENLMMTWIHMKLIIYENHVWYIWYQDISWDMIMCSTLY